MKELLKHWVASLLNNILLFTILIVLPFDIIIANEKEQVKYKPKINSNTKIRTEYGCKRPNWRKNKVMVKTENKDFFCYFTTRNVVLYQTSKIIPKIEVKNCDKNKFCCKIIYGKWELFDGKKYVSITNPDNIQIDHVLPFAYIRLNMNDCKNTDLFYNYIPNLKPELSFVNKRKKDSLCQNKEECENQKNICHMMSLEFNDKTLCEELDKIEVE